MMLLFHRDTLVPRSVYTPNKSISMQESLILRICFRYILGVQVPFQQVFGCLGHVPPKNGQFVSWWSLISMSTQIECLFDSWIEKLWIQQKWCAHITIFFFKSACWFFPEKYKHNYIRMFAFTKDNMNTLFLSISCLSQHALFRRVKSIPHNP